MNKEEKEAIEYYQNKEMSFNVDYDKAEFLKALGIEETEKDSFENHQIRIKTLLNLIDKQNKMIDLMAEEIVMPTIEDFNKVKILNGDIVKQYFEKEVKESD